MQFLNLENIAKSQDSDIEYHPLTPFLPGNCKVLFLGSFPPQRKRWCIDFFYPNFINDHWRIEGLIFHNDKNHFVDTDNKRFKLSEIVDFCNDKGIGFYDTSEAVRRLKDNASDKFLEIVKITDINKLIANLPQLKVIAVTGEKATENICQYFGMVGIKVGENCQLPDKKIHICRLPSSSRAYPMRIENKADEYRKMFQFAEIL